VALRYLAERHGTLFVVGVALAMLTATVGPVLQMGAAFGRPWKAGYVEKYDLRPEASLLLTLNVVRGAALVAGFLGVLLMLAAATAMPLSSGIALALLGLALGWWNTVPIGGKMW